MFKNKTVIITGGSSGVGKVIAATLLKRGARIAIVARDMKKLDAARTELSAGKHDNNITICSCDVTDSAAVASAIDSIVDSFGAPDILINSAGILIEGYFENLSEEVFRKTMDINFFGTLNSIRAALPHFKRAGGGRIVNMSSLSGVMGVFGYSAYCCSKYAVKGLSDCLRVELGPQNIKVHVVCAPEFDSPMVEEMRKGRTPENEAMAHMLPVLKAEDVARATINGMEKGIYEIVPGATCQAAARLAAIFPGVTRKLTDITVKRTYKGPII